MEHEHLDKLTSLPLKDFQLYPIGRGPNNAILVCEKCNALKFYREPPGFCCSGGVKLPAIQCPDKLLNLLENNKSFVSNLRRYNNGLALASNGLKEILPDGYHPNVKIQGQVYHKIHPLTPELGEEKTFAQIYIHDPDFNEEDELNRRMEVSSSGSKTMKKDIMKELQEMLHQVNPYVKDLKHVMDLPDNQVQNLKFVLKTNSKPTPKHVKGRYNLPTCNEVAVIQLNDEIGSGDVVIYRKDGIKQHISNMNRSYDPLHYVLLFPHGEDGWRDNITVVKITGKNNKEVVKNVTMRQFYAYRLQVRFNGNQLESPTLIRGARLLQEHACDQWAKIENAKLLWTRNHQKELRAETYQNLSDAIHKNDNATTVGQRIVLPYTIYGTPRWYNNAFQDGMAAVRLYGAPNLFITFSCNPKCKEIQDSLLPGQKSEDRPDIVARVYQMQMKEMKKDIVDNKAFGTVTSYQNIVEFQKRGLPHTHQLYTLADEDKPRTPEDVDKIVCAEIPNKETNPELYNLVKTFMVHGPCGIENPDAQCMEMKDGVRICSKGYPKPFLEATNITKNGIVQYRRRKNGRTIQVWCRAKNRSFDVSNCNIVPYNPALLLKYKAHINVEIVVGTKNSVKYLHKYNCKGPDRCLVETKSGDLVNDEVKAYQDSRFIGCTEAIWRTFEMNLRERYPPVMKLAIHLEGQQSVLFQDAKLTTEQLKDIAERNKTSMLTKYFELNHKEAAARVFTYDRILMYYRWDPTTKSFIKRKTNMTKTLPKSDDDNDDKKKSNQIGRMPIITLNPYTKELYFLRQLLHHIPGPKCFQDLRTVEGHVYETYQETCIAMGLFEDDKSVEQAFEEAAAFKVSEIALIHLFVTLVVHVMPANPVALWEMCKPELCAWRMKLKNVEEPTPEIINEVLLLMRAQFAEHGKDMVVDYKLPEPTGSLTKQKREVSRELDYDVEEMAKLAKENESKMNAEQLNFYKAVDTESGGVYAMQASGM